MCLLCQSVMSIFEFYSHLFIMSVCDANFKLCSHLFNISVIVTPILIGYEVCDANIVLCYTRVNYHCVKYTRVNYHCVTVTLM